MANFEADPWVALKRRCRPSRRFVQLTSDLVYGDAVSTDCIQIDRALRRRGFATALFASRIDEHRRGLARPYGEYTPAADDVLIFHYSAWSDVAEFVLGLARSFVLIYHNITPAAFYAGVDPTNEAITRRGREQLGALAERCSLALGKSEYSRQELAAAGFRQTGVLPFMVDFARLDGRPNARMLASLMASSMNLLVVGRVVPNKRVEDAIKTLYCLRRITPDARLSVVGAHDPTGPYCTWLHSLIERLDLADAVAIAGHVADADLLAFYRAATVYLSMSEHEGFCVPVVEAMALGVPVIAYAATAVPETVGGGGILIHRKDPVVVAEIIHRLAADQAFRQQIVAAGRRRAADFAPARVEAILARHLLTVVEQDALVRGRA